MNKSIGARVRLVRSEKKLTMEAFGDAIGISKQSVSKIEAGINEPAETTIRTICAKFGVDYFWLTTGSGEMYVDNLDLLIEEIASERGYDAETAEILKGLFELPPDTFETVLDLIRKLK